MSGRPTILYWHLWTDADGISRLTQCTMTEFKLKSMNTPADPQWQGTSFTGKMTTMVTVVPLSGRWFVEAMDGTRIERGPGEISFGSDQNCREVDGKRGHRSGTLGEVPAVLMVVQLEEASAPLSPCEFR
jgi:hypothetical protein